MLSNRIYEENIKYRWKRGGEEGQTEEIDRIQQSFHTTQEAKK